MPADVSNAAAEGAPADTSADAPAPVDAPVDAPVGVLVAAIEALPQHPPMRLLDRAVRIDACSAIAEIDVRADSPFLLDAIDGGGGIPAWVALEYLGQTAALIGMARDGAHVPGGTPADASALDGFLLGSRRMDLDPEPFRIGETLTVSCTARGEVGTTLATFDGEVRDASGRVRVSGTLSVVRVPRTDPADVPDTPGQRSR